MVTAVNSGMGLARMPCYIGDYVPLVRRLDGSLKPADQPEILERFRRLL